MATQPRLIEEIHRAYLEAGADIIETDTFNGTALSLEEFGLQDHVHELNRTAAELARHVADEFTRKDPDRPRFVAGSIGPTKKQLSMGIHVEDPGRRDVTFDEMVANYKTQIRALVEGGVDILLPETSFDTLVLKACLFAIDEFFEETGTRLPVMISGTIFDNHRTLSAQPVEAFYYSVSHFDALSVGLNCAVGVEQMRDSIESLAAICRTRISCYPNAGMPDGFGGFLGDKDHTAAGSRRVRPQRLAEHRRRLLRDNPGLDRGDRRGRRRGASATGSRPASLVQLQRHGAAGHPPRDQLHHDRRADQHHRLEEVRPADQERRLRVGPGRGARAGRGRRQHHRRQHGRGADRRREGHDPVSQPGLGRPGHRQGPDHDRQLQVECHRGRAEVRAGQVDRQLDQPEGGRGEVPRPGQAGPPLRRGGGRDGLRRDRPGGRQGRQGRHLQAGLQALDRGSRLSARGHHLRCQHPDRRHRDRGA